MKKKVYEFLDKDASRTYHVDFKSDNKDDQFSLNFAKFSGDVEINFYKNE